MINLKNRLQSLNKEEINLNVSMLSLIDTYNNNITAMIDKGEKNDR